MTIELNVTSSRIGSNPGGRCGVRYNGSSFNGYYKFCYGSKLPGESPFNASNQPIYEALTNQFAREFGLKTPSTWIVLNPKGDVDFKNWKTFTSSQEMHNPSGRKYYFLSGLIHNPVLVNPEEASKTLNDELPYLKALLISDVLNKKENYVFYPSSPRGIVYYVDVGCSFVHAVGGFLKQPHKLHYKDEKDVKYAIHKLKKYHLIGADDKKLINLEEFVTKIEDVEINTLNPVLKISIKNLLSSSEIDYIRALTVQGIFDELAEFDSRGLLIKS